MEFVHSGKLSISWLYIVMTLKRTMCQFRIHFYQTLSSNPAFYLCGYVCHGCIIGVYFLISDTVCPTLLLSVFQSLSIYSCTRVFCCVKFYFLASYQYFSSFWDPETNVWNRRQTVLLYNEISWTWIVPHPQLTVRTMQEGRGWNFSYSSFLFSGSCMELTDLGVREEP